MAIAVGCPAVRHRPDLLQDHWVGGAVKSSSADQPVRFDAHVFTPSFKFQRDLLAVAIGTVTVRQLRMGLHTLEVVLQFLRMRDDVVRNEQPARAASALPAPNS